MTNLLRKICQRLTDPFCYRKWIRVLLRGFRSFDDGGAGLESGCFRGLRHATVVIAHPDDESFCSGLICALKQQGTTVAVLCMTKGEGGPAGGHPREQLGQVREQEMRKACEELKVDELVFLGHIDPLGGEYRVFAPEVSAADLADQLLPHLEKTGLIISHGSSGEYWHPGHILVYEAVKDLTERLGEASPAWITFSARQPEHPLPDLVNWDDPAFLTIDGAPYERTRLRSLVCHHTQLQLFAKFAGGDHADFIRHTQIEAYALQKAGRDMELPGTGDQDTE